jgi:hypothetical protein
LPLNASSVCRGRTPCIYPLRRQPTRVTQQTRVPLTRAALHHSLHSIYCRGTPAQPPGSSCHRKQRNRGASRVRALFLAGREQGCRQGGEKLQLKHHMVQPGQQTTPQHLSSTVGSMDGCGANSMTGCGAPAGRLRVFVRGQAPANTAPPFSCPWLHLWRHLCAGGAPIPGTLPAQHGVGDGMRRAAGDGTRRHPPCHSGKPACP